MHYFTVNSIKKQHLPCAPNACFQSIICLIEELYIAALACDLHAHRPTPRGLPRPRAGPGQLCVRATQLARLAIVQQRAVGGAVLGGQGIEPGHEAVVWPLKGLQPFVLHAPTPVLAVAARAQCGVGGFSGGLAVQLAA